MQCKNKKKNNTMVRMVAIKHIPNSSRNLPWHNLLSCIRGKKVPQNPYRTQIEETESDIKTELGKVTNFIAFDVYKILIKQWIIILLPSFHLSFKYTNNIQFNQNR